MPEGKQGRCDDDRGHALFFSLVHFWLGRPVEEFDDVFGHLGGGGGRAVFVFDQAVVKDTGHSDAYD